MILVFMVSLILGVPAKAADQTADPPSYDLMAASSNDEAITRLKKIIPQRRGAPEEPDLYYSLGELLYQSADLRLQQGEPENIAPAKKDLREAIATFNTFVSRFPKDTRMVRIFYMRGRSFQDLEDAAHAVQDLRVVVDRYPRSEEARLVLSDVAEMLMQAQDYKAALIYLTQIRLDPQDSATATVLRHLTLAYYKTGNLLLAQSNLDALLQQLRRMPQNDSLRKLLFSSAIEMVPALYAEAITKKLPGFSVEQAIGAFKHSVGDEGLGRTMVGFTLQLRGQATSELMNVWKDQVVAQASQYAESLTVVADTLEGQLNRQEYNEISITTQQLVQLWMRHGAGHAEKIGSLAPRMQDIFEKNRDSINGPTVAKSNLLLLTTLLKADGLSASRRAEIYFNHGTLSLYLKDNVQAVADFQAAVADPTALPPAARKIAYLDLLQARLTLLKEQKLVPEKLQARALPKDTSASESVNPAVELFCAAVDRMPPEYLADADVYVFESSRALYSQGAMVRAMARLQEFINRRPSSPYAAPASALMMDTFIASQDWERAKIFSKRLAANRGFTNSEVKRRVLASGSDAEMMQVHQSYQAGDYSKAIATADAALAQGPALQRRNDLLLLSAQASAKQGNKADALRRYDLILVNPPQSENGATALYERAEIEESTYDFAKSASDELKFLELPSQLQHITGDDKISLSQKSIRLAWISGDLAVMQKVAQSGACGSAPVQCDQLLLLGLSQPPRSRSASTRAIQSVLELSSANHLGFAKKLSVLKSAIAAWPSLDPLAQIALINRVSHDLPELFKSMRSDLSQQPKLTMNPKSISARLSWLNQVEDTAQMTQQIPLARAHAVVWGEIARLYAFTAAEFTLPELAKPIRDKSIALNQRGIELAEKSGVEPFALQSLLDPKTPYPGLRPQPPFNLSALLIARAEVPKDLAVVLNHALEHRNVVMMGYLAHTTVGPEAPLIQASALVAAGAQAEALEIAQKNIEKLDSRRAAAVLPILIEAYAYSAARDQVKELVEQYNSISTRVDQALVSRSASWAGIRRPAGVGQ